MKRLLMLTLLLLLAACSPVNQLKTLDHPSPMQDLHASSSGLSLELVENEFTETPAVVETMITNDSESDYEYGQYYYIEVNKDGDWYTLVHSDSVFLDNPELTDFGLLLEAGADIRQNFALEGLKVELPPGHYRLVKTFLSREQPFYEVSLAVPFDITE